MDVITLEYFRDPPAVPEEEKEDDPVPDGLAVLLGLAFWAAFAGGVYASWPWLFSL